MSTKSILFTWLVSVACALHAQAPRSQSDSNPKVVDSSTLRGKVLCGYQGWFRCPGDSAAKGWIHWSRDSRRITPETLTFELWPDMTDYGPGERFAAPGFTDAKGAQCHLFSAAQAATVRRHFEWMRDYGIDGVWLQHFLVDLPGGPVQDRYATRWDVLRNVRAAASDTGRAWAITFDCAAMPTTNIVPVLTREWKKLVDEGITADGRYLHQGGKPVVQIWGFYYQNPDNLMTAQVATQLIEFFKSTSKYGAFLVGGGDWNWRRNPDPDWQAVYRRFDAYSPWNVGNIVFDKAGASHASMSYWAEDKRECEKNGVMWLPVIYPGFSWDNLQRLPAGKSLIPRRGGKFFWEQLHELSKMGVDSICVAMFDEVDEGTAIFKVTNTPPTQGHFVTYEGMPSDWYLRLLGAGTRLLHEKKPVPAEIPIQP